MKKRIFIGVRVSREVRDLYRLARVQFSGFNQAIRWVKAEDLHLTVAFLGWLKGAEVDIVFNLLDQVVIPHKPFTMQIFPRIKVYPSVARSTVLLFPVKKSKEFEQLQSSFLVHLRDLVTGISPQLRKSKPPHLTLGRVKGQRESLKQRLKEKSIIADKPVITEVTEVVLWESNLRPSGAEYSIMREVSL